MSKSNLRNQLGRALRSDGMAASILNAMGGDMSLRISPTTKTRAAGTGSWTQKVSIELVDSEGNVCEWLNKAFATTASVGDTSTAGTATIGSTTLTFENGRAEVTITGSNHAWVAAETATLTIANITVLGYTVTGGTCVVTIV